MRLGKRGEARIKESGIRPEDAVVGHANAQTLKTIRQCGFCAGLTVNPTRLRAETAVALIRRFGSEGVVIASDAGDGAHDILALPHTASVLEKQGLSPSIVRRVLWHNPVAFLRLDT